MKWTRRGLGLLGALVLSAFAGFAQPAAADVEVYFNPPAVYFGPPRYAPASYYVPAPAPWGWQRWEPGYYHDRGYYYRDGGQWRHDGQRWRHEQGYWRR